MGFFSEYKQVSRLLKDKQQVVFYAEGRHYYQYFEKLINDLLENNVKICYITSDASDPLLTAAPMGMQVFYVKWILGFLFSRIKASVMIMTMPDLGDYLFKRSSGVGGYIYMFHAAVSTHQQYRKKAFFNYDAIFCTGKYHVSEIRKTEEQNGLKLKQLISYGYPLYDAIRQKTKDRKDDAVKPTILVAPSWFEGCIFDTCIEELLQQLSKLPYRIVFRSHPEYEKRRKKSFRRIKRLISQYSNMSVDTEPNVIDRLPSTDILITDRSGIAFEFAFGTGRPVLFIDTILKETNPLWRELGIEPIENSIRPELGISISPNKLDTIPEVIKKLEEIEKGFDNKMEELKKNIFYNEELSYKNGVDFILEKMNNS